MVLAILLVSVSSCFAVTVVEGSSSVATVVVAVSMSTAFGIKVIVNYHSSDRFCSTKVT